MWRKGNPSTLLVGMQTGAATVENSMEFLQKLKIELPFDPEIPMLGCLLNFFVTLLYIYSIDNKNNLYFI